MPEERVLETDDWKRAFDKKWADAMGGGSGGDDEGGAPEGSELDPCDTQAEAEEAYLWAEEGEEEELQGDQEWAEEEEAPQDEAPVAPPPPARRPLCAGNPGTL